jgi:voltage-gated potassium channel
MSYSDLRYRVFDLLEVGRGRAPASRALDFMIATLIAVNVVAVIVETVPSIGDRYTGFFAALEVFSVAIFSIEYVARIWSCTADRYVAELGPVRGRIAMMLRPYQVIDLIAILPFYITIFAPLDLRALRIFRLLRFLKLARYSTAVTTLANVVVRESRSLFAALLLMAGMVIVASTVIYYVEREAQPEDFGSIPAAMWWALTTLTTVGYGDVTPVTVAGKIFGALVMVFGLGMAALPIGLLANGFGEEIQRRDVVHLLSDGDFFGERAVLEGGEREATAIARTEVRLLVLETEDLQHLVQSHPNIAEHLNKAAAEWREGVDFSVIAPTAPRD